MAFKVTTNKRVRIIINGVEYNSLDQIPPDLRAAYQQALRHAKNVSSVNIKLSANGEMPALSPGTVSDTPGNLEPERSVFHLLWVAVVVATLVSYGLYFYLRAR